MTPQISHDLLTISLGSEKGKFSILTQNHDYPEVVNAQLSLTYFQENKKKVIRLTKWGNGEEKPEWIDLPELGKVECEKFLVIDSEQQLCFKLTFGIVQKAPLVIWKMEMINQDDKPMEIQSITLMDIDPLQGGEVNWSTDVKQEDLGFFSNGWQSWSPSQWYAADDRMVTSKLGGLQLPMINNHGTPLPKEKGRFSSDFFCVMGDRTARKGFVLGSLSQINHFTSILADFNGGTSIKMWANGDGARLNPGCSMSTDWAVFAPISLDDQDPLAIYLEAVARENNVRVPKESPVGWCSWYHFYTKITEPIIKQNLKAIVDQKETLPIQLVQIDDGFESQIGDWFTFRPDFPQGVAPLAAEIKQADLLPGLWLAPFILHPKAEIIKQHPDWVLRKANGKPVNAGFVWNALTTALDITIPEALGYACQVVKTASEKWGYPYLKLDFLYAAAINCKYKDPTLTRAQVLRKGMEAIRNAVGPDVTLLGCGAPFGAMLGLVEAMRIGADVSGDWDPKFNGIGAFIKHEPAMPCARNSVRNILTRANLHQYWWINDPDCLLIRPDTHLSLEEVQSLASVIALTGGSLLVSDDLPKLTRDRLRIAECLLPVIGQRAQVLDWFDAEMPAKLRLDEVNETGEWHILSKFNWKDVPANITMSAAEYQLPADDYWVSEFWSGATSMVSNGGVFTIKNIPAHGCAVTAWRKPQSEKAVYLGSDLHISQGMEVTEWHAGSREINAKLHLPRKTSGKIRLYVKGEVKNVLVNGQKVDAIQDTFGILTFPLDFAETAEIKISL